MADGVAAVSQGVEPYESASALRRAHATLLEELDKQLEQEASAEDEMSALVPIEMSIRQFLERGRATGVYLEEIKERTACQVLLDYWVSILSQAGIQVSGVRLARFDGAQLPVLPDTPCPYVGLEAFRDQEYFFGRKDDTQTLLQKVRDEPLVVVFGTSGSGKSSLVMGGVLPKLAAELRIVPPFVPGNTVLDALVQAVRQAPAGADGGVAGEVAQLRQDPQHLHTMLGGADATPTLLTIDQFEEVFTLSNAADREVLVAQLAQHLKADPRHRVILTMREEFRSRMVELRALSPYLPDKAWYPMRPMGYEELKAAVEKPATLVNLQFQAEIVDDLVKKVLGQPAALPLLQFTLRALWQERNRNRITEDVYRRVGDPLNALRDSANKFYKGRVTETQDEVRRILLELVRVDELLEAYRQPVPKSRLMQEGKANTEAVLGLLAEHDYVRITSGTNDTDAVVEVKHESLIRNWPCFVKWIDDKRHQRGRRLALTQAAKRWEENGKPPEGLLTGWQTQDAQGQSDLSDLEKEFVQASAQTVGRMQRREVEQARAEEAKKSASRFRRLAVATVVVSLIAIVALYGAVTNSRKAAQASQQDAATSRQDAATARRVAEARSKILRARDLQVKVAPDSRLDLALLFGIEANRLESDQMELQQILNSILSENLELQSVLPGHTKAVREVASSEDGKILASGSFDGTIILWDMTSGRRLHPPLKGHKDAVFSLAFSPDGKLLASASADKTVRLWNVTSGQHTDPPLQYDTRVYSVAISQNTLASGREDGTVRLWNIESRKPGKRLAHGNAKTKLPVYNVAFSPDGTLLASGGQDGRIVLWDVKTQEQKGKPLPVESPVWSMAFSHDGRIIASGGMDGRVQLWDIQERRLKGFVEPDHSASVYRENLENLASVYSVAFSRDDRRLATVHRTDRTVSIRDVQDLQNPPDLQKPPLRLKGYATQFYSVVFTEGDKLVTGNDKGAVVLWDLQPSTRIGTTLQTAAKSPTWLAVVRDNKTLVWFAEGKRLSWDFVKGQQRGAADVGVMQDGIALIVPAPDGKVLAVVGTDNSVKMWDVSTQRLSKTLVEPGERPIPSAAFSADSQTLAVGVMGAVQLFSLPEGTLNKTLGPGKPDDVVGALAFGPKGKLLAYAVKESGITVWDLATSRPGTTGSLRRF